MTDEHVRKAIAAIVDELYRRKHPTRFWDPSSLPTGESERQEGGYTALTVLALLSAGESYQDPRLRDAVAHLETARMRGTYAVAVRCAVWAKLPARFHELLAADTRWLLEGFSERAAGWDYVQRPTVQAYDNSLRQYGALALWEAAKRGVQIDPRYWTAIEQALLDGQFPDGAWNYKLDTEPSGSMTTAGLATLFITQDLLHGAEHVPVRRDTETSRLQRSIEQGLGWLDRHYAPDQNPGTFRDFYYYSYGVERVGLASGRKFLGGRDWYREGAAEIIRRLCAWDAKTAAMTVTPQGNRLDATYLRQLDFGLMFLSRGRVPVAVNKLLVEDIRWNNRPRDVANLTDRIRGVTETELNWQIVDATADPRSWLDAPLLYLASHEALPWASGAGVDVDAWRAEARSLLLRRATGAVPATFPMPQPQLDERALALRTYLDLGGMLLAVQEGRGDAFASSVRSLGLLLYPHLDWRPLEEDHWAYTIHRPVEGRRPALAAMSNGVRELIILDASNDLAGDLQGNEQDKTAAFDVAANLYLYASELNRPRPRLDRHAALPLPASAGLAASGTTATITVARAMYGGRWNPEPLALPALRGALPQAELAIVDYPLSQIDRLEPPPALVMASGVEAHAFDEAERGAVERYVRRGGVILFETAGGGGAFTLSAEEMAAKQFGQPIRSLARHPLVTGDGTPSAADLSEIAYRPYALEVFGARETRPRLRGMEIDGQVRILFSREDLTHALLDQPRWGVCGYAPASARALMASIVLHGMAETANSR